MPSIYPNPGPPRPGFRYPRIVWNGQTFDFPDPLAAVSLPQQQVGFQLQADGGPRESVVYRIERQLQLTTGLMDADSCEELDRFLSTWALPGEQFEFYLDRNLAAYWGFEGHARDNNGDNAFLIASSDAPAGNDTGAAFSYVALSTTRGITVPSGARQAMRVSLVNGANAFVAATAAGGVLALLAKPDWAFNDSLEHVFIDAVIPDTLGANRLRFVKRADNKLYLTYAGANGAETLIDATPASWLANTEHTFLLQWGALADLKVRVDGTLFTTAKYPTPASGSVIAGGGTIAGAVTGTPSGNEQTWSAAPTRLTLGVDDLVLGGRATGAVGLLALYRTLFDGSLPAVIGQLRHPWLSYIAQAELVDTRSVPVRPVLAKDYYVYSLTLRDGG